MFYYIWIDADEEMLVKERQFKQATTILTSSQWHDWHSKCVLKNHIPQLHEEGMGHSGL